jgi:hypothetical protein
MNYKSRKPAAKKPEDSDEESKGKEIPVPVVRDLPDKNPDEEPPVDNNQPGCDQRQRLSRFGNDHLLGSHNPFEYGREALRKRGTAPIYDSIPM